MAHIRGFSLIEALVVLGALVMLIAIVIPGFSAWRSRNAVSTAVRDVESVLKLARSKTLASEDGASYGVFFTNGDAKYSLCKNPDANCNTLVNDRFLPGGLIFCPTPTNINFSKLTGTTGQSQATIYFYNKNAASPCAMPGTCITDKICGGVTVMPSGVVYEEK